MCIRDRCKTSIYDDYNEEPENGLLFYENNPVTFSVSAKSLKGDELTYQWYRKDNENPTAVPRKLQEDGYYKGVTTSTLEMPVSTQACQEDYSYFCVIGRKGDPTDTVKTAEAKLTATHAYSYQQAGVPVPTDDSERTPKYNVTWVDKNGDTHVGVVGGDPKCDGHKLPCLFEAGSYEAHYMTTGSKERIFPHTFVLDRSYEAVGGGKVDVLICTVCDYTVPVKSHVHDYGWNWDYTGFGSIYEYTFNIGGSTKTVEQLILESDYAHPEKCKVPGCEEFIMVPHSWGRWNVVENPDTTGGKGGMEAECSVCEYTKTKIDKDDDGGADHWTKDTALVTVINGRATRMIVKPGDKIKLYPEERNGQKAIGWKVEYLREYNEYDIISGTGLPVHKQWNTGDAKTLFKLVTDGSALEWGCTIPEFTAMGAPGGGIFTFEPVYEGCDHSGGTTVLNAKAQVCDRKGYTGDTACADCGHIISAGSYIYPPANAGHTGPLQPLYYYGTTNSATTDASHGGKRYNANSGDCRHREYEGDYRCTACGGTVKGETGDFKHSGPLERRDVRAATCTEKGYSGNQYCTACNRIAQKGSSTPSLHEIAGNYQLINAVKPTCTAVGYSGDYQCTGDCGQIFRYGHVIDKSGHDWNSGETATQGNSNGILYTCRRVGCGETRFVKTSAATGYTVTVIKGTASVAAGTPITDKIEQNTVVTVTADAPEIGKVFDKWVVLEGNVTLADATKATTTFTMPASAVKLEATYKDAPHTHTFDQEIIKGAALKTPADCTNDAVYYKSCSCGTISTNDADTFTATDSALGHAWPEEGSWSKDADKHWYECSRCHLKKDEAAHDYGDDDICDICTYDNSVPHTHNLTLVDENPATCTTPGNKAYYTCDGCDKWFEDASGSVEITDKTSVIIRATGHTPSGWKSDADNHWKECTAVGCGVIIEDSKAAHTASDWITDTEATATTDGTKHKECTICGYVMETGTIPATGSGEHTHSYGSDWKSNADKHWHECSCGVKDDVAAHSFKWVIDKEATATKKGTKHEECKVCGYQRPAVEIPATGSTTKPTDPTESNPNTGALDDVPQTGDNSNMILWIVLLLASGLGVTGTVMYSKRKKYVK